MSDHTVISFSEHARTKIVSTATLGPRGAAGRGFVWREEWAPTTAYALDDVVKNGTSIYLVTTAHTSGGSFDASKFDLMIEGAGGGIDVLNDLSDVVLTTPLSNDLLQLKAGEWVNRSPSQVKTDLALTKADVALGNVPNVDATSRSNHLGTQLASTISDFAAAADARVALVVDSAPGTLDTLNELAAALGDDPNFATTLTNLIAAKVSNSLFDANSILKADTDDTPVALPVAASRIIGRNTTGGIAALDAAAVKSILALVKGDVGLGNVDNTSDANKPISTATQAALDAKQALDADLTAIAAMDSSVAGAIASDGAGWIKKTYAQFKTALGLVKADVGLSNVDNTSDTDKPVSTAQQTALDLKLNTSLKGAANGLAELDGSGKVPSGQLPAFVDDVLEFANFAGLPGTGTAGLIYVTLDDNKTYRWSGSAYVEISASLVLGETSTTAYRGDRGKTAYDHSQLTSGNPHNVTKTELGLGNVDNTSDATKNSATATLTNKRITQRVQTLTDAATVTPDIDSYDGGKLLTLSQATQIANPTGTPTTFQRYMLRIKSTSARALTFGSQFRFGADVPTLTTTTGSSLTDYLLFQWNVDDSKWDVISYVRGY